MDFGKILSSINPFASRKPLSPEGTPLVRSKNPWRPTNVAFGDVAPQPSSPAVSGKTTYPAELPPVRQVTPQPQVSPAAPAPTSGVQVAPPQVLGAQTSGPVTPEQIQAGWAQYGDGNAPAATMSAVFADVANQYPVLQKYPGLLPAMNIQESSGNKAKTKNGFNWGLYNPSYQETNPEQVIRDVAAAIGGEDSPSSHYYEDFRNSGDIMDLLNRYAPPTENDTSQYHQNVLNWMKMFE